MSRLGEDRAKVERLVNEGRCHELASVPGLVWAGVVEDGFRRFLVTSVAADAVYKLGLGTGMVPAFDSCTCGETDRSPVSMSCVHVVAAARLRALSTPTDVLFAEAS